MRMLQNTEILDYWTEGANIWRKMMTKVGTKFQGEN